MNSTATVPVQSAWLSKINWGEGLKIVAMVGTITGTFSLDVETQNHVLMGIISAGAVYTWAMRSFFTTTVTPTAAKKV